MPRYSPIYSDFVERIKEVDKIATTARRYERIKPFGSQSEIVSALCRGGVVLLSSHIEGYISDLNEAILDTLVEKQIPIEKLATGFRYYLSKDIVDEISDTSEPAAITKKLKHLHKRDTHIWDDHPHFTNPLDSEKFMKGFSTPKPKNIYKLFRRYGHNNVKNDMMKKLRGDFIRHEANVDSTVNLRNDIAHGDGETTLTPDDLRLRKKSTHIFCREIDDSVCKWFGSLKCGLR